MSPLYFCKEYTGTISANLHENCNLKCVQPFIHRRYVLNAFCVEIFQCQTLLINTCWYWHVNSCSIVLNRCLIAVNYTLASITSMKWFIIVVIHKVRWLIRADISSFQSCHAVYPLCIKTSVKIRDKVEQWFHLLVLQQSARLRYL